jgi:hypothetical protein
MIDHTGRNLYLILISVTVNIKADIGLWGGLLSGILDSHPM